MVYKEVSKEIKEEPEEGKEEPEEIKERVLPQEKIK